MEDKPKRGRKPHTSPYKTCRQCFIEKPINEFDRKDPKNFPTHIRPNCKECRKKYNAIIYEKRRIKKFNELKEIAEKKGVDFIAPKRIGVIRKNNKTTIFSINDEDEKINFNN